MDGTLWDNVDNYVISWNRALDNLGYPPTLTRKQMIAEMGKEVRKIVEDLFPDVSTEKIDLLLDEIDVEYNKLVPTMKSKVYHHVIEGLNRLKTKYKLLLLSNCEEGGLVNFMNYTKTNHLILDYMEYGQNNMPKSFNLKLLKEKHQLKSPIYIGDTEGDSRQSSLADIPFVFVTYGFGKTEQFNLQFHSFEELTEYFMSL